MYETRRIDTKEVCEVHGVAKCCNTCTYFGYAPDGAAECDMLIECQDGEPMVTTSYDDQQELSHPLVGGYNICDCWVSRTLEQEFEDATDDMAAEISEEVDTHLLEMLEKSTLMLSDHAHKVTIHVPQAIEGAKDE